MHRHTSISLPCLCGSFRRASRALTQFYEQELRPLGLRATQLTILQVLSRAGELSQGRLAEILAMDSSSLTRTLVIMRRHGWVSEHRGRDRRERLLRLAKPGTTQLNRAAPVWEKIQSRLRARLGKRAFEDLLQFNTELTEMTTSQGGSI